ncbi:uroporphyrinogen-III synthase [Nesterenkonia sp. YGD6]|uniref:uroporphyrinogen-III synthase n=1 Tax=Nesterenkonia sp. YGD6 TaxID=2901231 RepID=UPI001F4D333E|nr:uroporphyrinogen-III synthase [Nesterenkonia sp. YGD6]MCH8562061.1 uroporphyrinogen-III synthase [Nesterenkonia sp. YGD6]
MRIALTRDPAQAGPLEAGLRAAGLQVQFLPVTEQRLPADTTELTTALERLSHGDFAWVLFTSANTVRALVKLGWDGTVPAQGRVGVVGPGTARVLRTLTGITSPWMPEAEKSAAGMIQEIPEPAPGANTELLLPQSAQARSQLRDGLSAIGWQVTQVSAYETDCLVVDGTLAPGDSDRRLLPQPAREDLLDLDQLAADLRRDRLTHVDPTVLLVTSSSAADGLADLGVPERVRLLAIGRPTARTLSRRGIPAASVLSEPSADAVMAALGR